jgi:hypothetical protein
MDPSLLLLGRPAVQRQPGEVRVAIDAALLITLCLADPSALGAPCLL